VLPSTLFEASRCFRPMIVSSLIAPSSVKMQRESRGVLPGDGFYALLDSHFNGMNLTQMHRPEDGEATKRMTRFVTRYLDPASRLGEILFGLIMVLTVTLTAGLAVAEGRAGVRQLLFTAIGCNLAWGIIDAVMYIMNCLTERSGRVRLIEAVQHARDNRAALDIIQNEIEPELQSLLDPEEREAFSRSILTHMAKARITRPGVMKDDVYGALACFLLVFVSCLPAAIPFFIFSQPHFALRVSNFLLIALLFLVGRKWAQYAGTDGRIAGTMMVVIGLVLVGIAILLGG
jgi:VIT1/CCC1 family predicted Fe2+/Mn2+ transporter